MNLPTVDYTYRFRAERNRTYRGREAKIDALALQAMEGGQYRRSIELAEMICHSHIELFEWLYSRQVSSLCGAGGPEVAVTASPD